MRLKKFIYLIFCSFLLTSCSQKQHDAINPENSNSKIIQVSEDNFTPTVDIEKYSLIINPGEDRQADADKILSIKRKWPLIMQTPTAAGFDSILAKNFTFIDHGHLLNRSDYIKDRTKPSDWKITFVKYENLSLQFFDETAVLTYRNHVTNENTNTKSVEVEHINWVDIYTKENNKWKISSAHVVDITIEKLK